MAKSGTQVTVSNGGAHQQHHVAQAVAGCITGKLFAALMLHKKVLDFGCGRTFHHQGLKAPSLLLNGLASVATYLGNVGMGQTNCRVAFPLCNREQYAGFNETHLLQHGLPLEGRIPGWLHPHHAASA